jgi:hypothetical protein
VKFSPKKHIFSQIMGSVEDQLAEYRARKAKERSANQSSGLGSFSILRRTPKNIQNDKKVKFQNKELAKSANCDDVDDRADQSAESDVTTALTRKACFILYCHQ